MSSMLIFAPSTCIDLFPFLLEVEASFSLYEVRPCFLAEEMRLVLDSYSHSRSYSH